MSWTDDPVADANRYAAKQEEELKKLPRCDFCGYKIQEEHFYLINDSVICEECLEDNFKKRVEDYIE